MWGKASFVSILGEEKLVRKDVSFTFSLNCGNWDNRARREGWWSWPIGQGRRAYYASLLKRDISSSIHFLKIGCGLQKRTNDLNGCVVKRLLGKRAGTPRPLHLPNQPSLLQDSESLWLPIDFLCFLRGATFFRRAMGRQGDVLWKRAPFPCLSRNVKKILTPFFLLNNKHNGTIYFPSCRRLRARLERFLMLPESQVV